MPNNMIYTLPEFAFLKEVSGAEVSIFNRLVIVHPKTASFFEVVTPQQLQELPGTPYLYKFDFSILGNTQKMILFVHSSNLLQPGMLSSKPLDDLLKRCGEWFQVFFDRIKDRVGNWDEYQDE